MELIYRKRFLKDLKKLPSKSQLAIKEVLDKLYAAKSLDAAGVDCKLMEGQKDGQQFYRIRVGKLRIGVEYVNPELIVIIVAYRGDIYKEFPPR